MDTSERVEALTSKLNALLDDKSSDEDISDEDFHFCVSEYINVKGSTEEIYRFLAEKMCTTLPTIKRWEANLSRPYRLARPSVLKILRDNML